MPEDIDVQRCLTLVTLLTAEHGWELTPEIQRRYAEQVVAHCSDGAGSSEARLCAAIRYYHHDHALVDALRDPSHPENSQCWAEWTRQTLRFLTAKTRGVLSTDEAGTNLDDLTQEAVHDLWRGLRTFNYQSSFQTWAFSVIGHCLARHYRAFQTQKRSALPAAHSLDAMLAVGDSIQDHVTPPPEEAALGDTLEALVWRVLEEHPDRRLTTVFQLWACEEQTLRVIGDQLHLSPTRVHALLKQAIHILRSEQAIQDWAQHDPSRILAT
jgi:RNA polymerase sigma factor (sigma-70 family)